MTSPQKMSIFSIPGLMSVVYARIGANTRIVAAKSKYQCKDWYNFAPFDAVILQVVNQSTLKA
jgi:hypothetical protein